MRRRRERCFGDDAGIDGGERLCRRRISERDAKLSGGAAASRIGSDARLEPAKLLFAAAGINAGNGERRTELSTAELGRSDARISLDRRHWS